MQVFIPGFAVQPNLSGLDNFIDRETLIRYAIPVYLQGTTKEVPSVFKQITRGRPINDVFHVKPITYRGSMPSETLILSDGRQAPSAGRCMYKYSGSVYNNVSWSSSFSRTVCFVTTAVVKSKFTISGTKFYVNTGTITVRVDKGVRISKTTGYIKGLHVHLTIKQHESTTSSYVTTDVTVNGEVVIKGGTKIGLRFPSIDECPLFDTRAEASLWAHDYMQSGVGELWVETISAYTSLSNTTVGKRQYPVSRIKPIRGPEYAKDLLSFASLSQGIDPMLLGNGIENGSYTRNWLIQHAYADALEQAPVMNDNNIQNLAEVFKFIKTLVVDKRVEIPTSLQDAWLSYRYSYTTSKMDYQEAVDFVHRQIDLKGKIDRVKCFGASSAYVGDTLITCRCSLSLTQKKLEGLVKAWDALYMYGLQPNFYVIWDAIPYSFIADWFLPIGDVAHVLDLEQHYMTGNYDIEDVCFSISYDLAEDEGLTYHHYYRWASDPLENLNGFYWFDKPAASDKVQAFRILDLASLVTSK